MPLGQPDAREVETFANAPHLDWASRIKRQHYRLQALVNRPGATGLTGASPQDDDGQHAGNAAASPPLEAADPAVCVARSAEEELRQWQAVIRSSEEQQRLTDYAAAMHDLATKYWEAAPPPDAGASTPHVGEKRVRTDEPAHTAVDEQDEPLTAADARDSAAIAPEAFQQRRYNDRVQASLDCVESFFLGQPRARAASPASDRPGTGEHPVLYATYPLIVSRALKPQRRQFFRAHGRMATAEEVNGMLLERLTVSRLVRGRQGTAEPERDPRSCWDWTMDYAHLLELAGQRVPPPSLPPHTATSTSAPAPVPAALHALDIGSCYGPFFGRSFEVPGVGTVPLRVTAMDLCPYREEGDSGSGATDTPVDGERVWRADWLSVSFYSRQPSALEERVRLRRAVQKPPAPKEPGEAAAEDACAALPEVEAVALASFDVVFFCLLLSYLPTSRLRFRACLHASLALRPGGLLVIVSTRTQGSRKSRWVEEWVSCLDTIGFTAVHKTTREKIVVQSFMKRPSGEDESLGQQHQPQASARDVADAEAWIGEMMQSPAAERGLTIMADTSM